MLSRDDTEKCLDSLFFGGLLCFAAGMMLTAYIAYSSQRGYQTPLFRGQNEIENPNPIYTPENSPRTENDSPRQQYTDP